MPGSPGGVHSNHGADLLCSFARETQFCQDGRQISFKCLRIGVFFACDLIQFILTIIYVALGLFVFGVGFWIFCKITPFSVTKEIEEDQNAAVAIIIGSVIIGLAIIIAAAIT